MENIIQFKIYIKCIKNIISVVKKKSSTSSRTVRRFKNAIIRVLIYFLIPLLKINVS